MLKAWPARQLQTEQGLIPQGLTVRTHHLLCGESAEFKLDLGEESRFWPSDEALAMLGQTAAAGQDQARIIYD